MASRARKAGTGLSIERFLLVNALMDAALLALGLRLSGGRLTVRLVPAAILGALYALACAVARIGWLRSLPMQTLAMLLMLLVAGGRPGRGMGRQAAATAVSALVVGGSMGWLSSRVHGDAGYALSAAAGCAAICLWRDRRQMRLTQLTVSVCARQQGGVARFEALIDTGNRLREPVSGLPVLIAEERLLADILPDSGRMRRIPFGGLGGCGFLEAFRPQALRFCMDGRWLDAPGVWLAVYRGHMSGSVHALAPPVFALRASAGQSHRDYGGGK